MLLAFAGGVVIRVGDAGEVVLVVVGVLGHVLGRVGDRDQPVSVVPSDSLRTGSSIRRLLPVLVRYRSTSAPSVIVIRKYSARACSILSAVPP